MGDYTALLKTANSLEVIQYFRDPNFSVAHTMLIYNLL